MKKLISLIASLSLAATMFTSFSVTASAAALANNAPVVDTTVRELTNDEYYNDWMEEDIPAGQKAFLIEATVSGLDLAIKAQGTSAAKKTKRDGVGLTASGYEIIFDSAANIAAVTYMDGVGSPITTKTAANAWAATGVKEALPTVDDGDTTGKTSTGMLIYQAVVTTKGEVTGRVEAMMTINEVSGESFGNAMYCEPGGAVEVAYTVAGESGNTVTFGGTAQKDPIEIVGDRYDLADGFAWDIQVNEYQPAKTYTATFTDVATSETKVNDFDFSSYVEAQADATFGFVALLKTLKTNVTLSVQ